MRMLRIALLTGGLAIAAVFPALGEEGQQPAPAEEHSGHHEQPDQPKAQQAPSGGMMGGGMMGREKDGQGMGGMMGGCPMMGDMMGHGGGMRKRMGQGMMHSVPMMEARLAYIKADLAITEAQASAWSAYADAVRARHSTMQGAHADMMKAKESGNALDRMDARIKATESRLESLKAVKPALVALYAVLTDEQKKKADQLLGGGCGMM